MIRLFLCLTLITFALRSPCQCVANNDFESSAAGGYTLGNAISGWTISSQSTSNCSSTNWTGGSPEFSIVSTPVLNLPGLGALGNSPFGGSKIAQLNNLSANSIATKISHTFSIVTQQYFAFAYAAIVENGNHSCCQNAGLTIQVKDPNGNNLSCYEHNLAGTSTLCTNVTYTTSGNWLVKSWTLVYLDLCMYQNTPLTLEVSAKDCSSGDHMATVFLDANCGLFSGGTSCWGQNPTTVSQSYCQGSNVAYMQAPLGYATYSWQYPTSQYTSNPISQNNQHTLAINNPIPGSTFTVFVTNQTGCGNSFTTQLNPGPLAYSGLGSQPSCVNGASGSATIGMQFPAPYTYTWTNSTGSVVGNTAIVTNLLPGNYSVTVQGNGTVNCSTSATVAVGIYTPGLVNLLMPSCNNPIVLNKSGGSNYQWYAGTTPISFTAGGNAPTYTVNTPINNSTYLVTHTTAAGCKDSTRYTVIAVNPGQSAVSQVAMTCSNATMGMAVIQVSLSAASPTGQISYSVYSTNTLSPYTASLFPTAQTSFTALNMPAGTYSVKINDGLCSYTNTLTIFAVAFDYTFSPQNYSVCSGNMVSAGVTFTSPPSLTQYSYSWSPTIFLSGNNGSFISTIITPTTPLGTQTTIVYSVVVTPSAINCPLTKTLSLFVANYLTPTLSAIPVLCGNSPTLTVVANPPGGVFHSPSNLFNGAVLIPSLALTGLNNYTYTIGSGNCTKSTAGTFSVNNPPLQISAPPYVCSGATLTLTASGAQSYTWNNIPSGPTFTSTPVNPFVYTVTGADQTGCAKIMTVSVPVKPLPTLSILGKNPMCAGLNNTLTVSGASSYTWGSAATGSQTVVNPLTSSTFSASGTGSFGCIGNAVFPITVIPIPTLIVSGLKNLCSGQSTTLSVTGAQTYNWLNNNFTGTTQVLQPQTTYSFYVVGTTSNTCSSNTIVTLFVTPCAGISHQLNEPEIALWPTITSGEINLINAEQSTIQIRDPAGKLVFHRVVTQNKTTIDLGPLPPGVYFVSVSKNGTLLSRKRIVKVAGNG